MFIDRPSAFPWTLKLLRDALRATNSGGLWDKGVPPAWLLCPAWGALRPRGLHLGTMGTAAAFPFTGPTSSKAGCTSQTCTRRHTQRTRTQLCM